jgi:hypothetical protein
MEISEEQKALIRRHIANWKVISAELEKERAERLRAMTEEESAEIFNGLDCDPSLVWIPEHRRTWSGLVEQQKYFSKAHPPSAIAQRRSNPQ